MTALIKQINPTTKEKINPPRYKKDPFIYLCIKSLFVELIKLVIISIRIYKEYYRGN
jgi:hypothetical protein